MAEALFYQTSGHTV